MLCIKFPSLRFWRKKKTTADDAAEKSDFAPRPLHDSVISGYSTFSDVEKPLLKRQSLFGARKVPAPAAISVAQPGADKRRSSAYSAPASGDGPRYRAISRTESDSWNDSPTSTLATDASGDFEKKLKEKEANEDRDDDAATTEEVVDEAEARRRKQLRIQKEFEEQQKEESDHRDFLQML